MKSLIIVTALALSSCAAPALAESNQSNASGTNTTSFTGAPGSIWDGDRVPLVKPIPVFSAPVPVCNFPRYVEPVKQPEVIFIPVEDRLPTEPIVKPAPAPKAKPVYKPAKGRAPRGRG
jgi:hypothetical protein